MLNYIMFLQLAVIIIRWCIRLGPCICCCSCDSSANSDSSETSTKQGTSGVPATSGNNINGGIIVVESRIVVTKEDR